MGRAILIIGAGALAVGVIIYALIESAQSDKYAVRAIPKWGWLLVILLLPVVGAVLWLFFGRPRKDDAAREPQRGRGPDDDPQFLRNLEERRKQQERARKLQEWENELKRTGRAPGEHPDAEEPPLDPSDPRLAAPSPGHPAGDVRADDPDDVAGFHWTKVHPASGDAAAIGEVYAVGIAPDHQGHGLGRALTAAGINHLAEQGLDEVMLYVDADNPAAMALYESLGFERWHVDVMYRS